MHKFINTSLIVITTAIIYPPAYVFDKIVRSRFMQGYVKCIIDGLEEDVWKD